MQSLRPLVCAALIAALLPAPANALEPEKVSAEADASGFSLADQAALFSGGSAPPLARLPGANVWSRGLSPERLPGRAPQDRAVGVNVNPVSEAPLTLGMEMVRPSDPAATVQSNLTWRYVWEHATRETEPLVWGVTSNGSYGLAGTSGSQAVAPYLDYRLAQAGDRDMTKLRLAPEISYDVAGAKWASALTPELRHEVKLNETAGFTPTLSLSAGTRLAPEAKPAFTTGIELRFTPPG